MGSVRKRCPECGVEERDPEISFCARDGTPLETAQVFEGDLIGHEIAGRYRILEPVGEGGMGTVYRARQLEIDRDVALKIIRPELAQDLALQARFRREARSASRVQSIRIVTLFDYGQTDDGLMFMAMELLDGESVADRLEREGALSPKEAVEIAAEVTKALEAAHELDVVHRDLKPDNVFLTSKEKLVKVLDFGIAKIIGDGRKDEGVAVTAVGAIVGTPMYMSPEAAAGRRTIGPATDLYSLGVMLFEMLTGRPPFSELEPVLLLGMHIKARPPLLREMLPGLAIPDALEDLVDRLLAKKPSERPESATAVVEELEALLPGLDDAAPVRGSAEKRATATETLPASTLALSTGELHRAHDALGKEATGTPPPAPAPRNPRTPLWIAAAIVALGIGGWVIATGGNTAGRTPDAAGTNANAGQTATTSADAGAPRVASDTPADPVTDPIADPVVEVTSTPSPDAGSATPDPTPPEPPSATRSPRRHHAESESALEAFRPVSID